MLTRMYPHLVMLIFSLTSALGEDNIVLVRVKNTTADHEDEYVIEYKDIDNDNNDTEHGKDYQEQDIDISKVGIFHSIYFFIIFSLSLL